MCDRCWRNLSVASTTAFYRIPPVHNAHRPAFNAYLAPLHKIDWVVYCKKPFAGPAQVLRYLSRYTHRIAISNRRLISADHKRVTFKVKDYRIEGPDRYTRMTMIAEELPATGLVAAPRHLQEQPPEQRRENLDGQKVVGPACG